MYPMPPIRGNIGSGAYVSEVDPIVSRSLTMPTDLPSPVLPRTAWRDFLALAVLVSVCLLLTAFLPWSDQAGHFTRSLSTSGPIELRVETGSGGITVHRGSGSTLVIQGTIHARHPEQDAAMIRQLEQDPPVHQMGNRIQVGPVPHEWSRRISISYEIEAPASTSASLATGSGDVRADGLQGDVHASTGSGSIEVSQIGQMLHADTGSGDITVRNVHGEARLQTGSGSIHAYALAGPATLGTGSGDITIAGSAQSTRADTGSGSIRATDLHSDFRARTGSGDVTAQGVLPNARRWDLSTGSGSIDLTLPQATHASIDLQTDSGSIHSNIPVQLVGKMSPRHLTGTMGGGDSSAWLVAHTGSGDIRIH